MEWRSDIHAGCLPQLGCERLHMDGKRTRTPLMKNELHSIAWARCSKQHQQLLGYSRVSRNRKHTKKTQGSQYTAHDAVVHQVAIHCRATNTETSLTVTNSSVSPFQKHVESAKLDIHLHDTLLRP
jgi:O-glycosyl hydrolase